MLKHVNLSKFNRMDNSYIAISANWRDDNKDVCIPNVSFIYDGGEFFSEWYPPFGDIVKWKKVGQENSNAIKHCFCDFAIKEDLSALAVDNEELPRKFVEGDYSGIFLSLSQYC